MDMVEGQEEIDVPEFEKFSYAQLEEKTDHKYRLFVEREARYLRQQGHTLLEKLIKTWKPENSYNYDKHIVILITEDVVHIFDEHYESRQMTKEIYEVVKEYWK